MAQQSARQFSPVKTAVRHFCISVFAVFCAALFSVPLAAAQVTPTPEQCAEAWRDVHEQNTLAAYQGFVQFFSTCPEVEDAQRAISLMVGDEETRGPGIDPPAPPAFCGETCWSTAWVDSWFPLSASK